jgi:hypothetical protein
VCVCVRVCVCVNAHALYIQAVNVFFLSHAGSAHPANLSCQCSRQLLILPAPTTRAVVKRILPGTVAGGDNERKRGEARRRGKGVINGATGMRWWRRFIRNKVRRSRSRRRRSRRRKRRRRKVYSKQTKEEEEEQVLFKGLFTVSAVDFIERELLWVVEEEEDRGKALYGRIIQNIKSCGLSGLSCHEFRV